MTSPVGDQLLHIIGQSFSPEVNPLDAIHQDAPTEDGNNVGEGKTTVYDKAAEGLVQWACGCLC